MFFAIIFGYILPIVVVFILLFCVAVYVTTQPYPNVWRYDEERFYFNPISEKKEAFPSLNDDWSIHISVIVPAYNEEERLPPMLDECLEYLEDRKTCGLVYEIIVVSDGSTDRTVEIAHRYAKNNENIRVLALVKNRGKGGAVRLGIQSARGSVLLFADADGATKFDDLDKLDNSLKEVLGVHYGEHPDIVAVQHAIICGSRAHLEEKEISRRSFFRLFLMYGFHFLVWLFCVRGVRDTQCGFKLVTRESARLIFDVLHVERWAFDVEMLYIAQTLKIPVMEVAVNWTEIEGSKLVPFWSWLQMGRDLGLIWLRYRIGAWKLSKPKSS